MDVSERILRTWMPAIHAGLTREENPWVSVLSDSWASAKLSNSFSLNFCRLFLAALPL
jgi:hypothetical protein